MAQEKRRSPRIKTSILVKYLCRGAESEKTRWDTSAVNDISQHGVCINTMQEFLPGENLTLYLRIPTSPLELLEIVGKAVESKPIFSASGKSVESTYITRVEFVNLHERHKELIGQYVKMFHGVGKYKTFC